MTMIHEPGGQDAVPSLRTAMGRSQRIQTMDTTHEKFEQHNKETWMTSRMTRVRICHLQGRRGTGCLPDTGA
jgi:hypothetical protein